MGRTRDTTSVIARDAEPNSALLAAARQLSEEAALRPRVAGLNGARRRTATIRIRRGAQRTVVTPAA